MGGHIFPALHHLIERTIGMQTSWLIQFVLTTVVLVGPGRRLLHQGLAGAAARRARHELAGGDGHAGGLWLFAGGDLRAAVCCPRARRAVYFEAAAVIVVLILLGRWLEARAKGRTGAAIRG